MKVIFFATLSLFCLALSAQQKDLQYFIQQAQINSPLLLDYKNQIRNIQIDSLRIHAENGFRISAVSNNYYAPVIKSWGYDEIITDVANISAQLAVTKELTGRANLMNRYRLLQVQQQSVMNTANISVQDLVKNVTQQYITVYGSLQEYLYQTDVLKLLKQEEFIIRKLTEQNTFNQTDYLAFMVTLQQQQSRHIQASGQFRTDLSVLNYLCGLNDTALIKIPVPSLTITAATEAGNSLFYTPFINDSLKLTLEDQQIDFSYQPKISLFGDAGYYSSLMSEPWKNFGASAGISLTMPIYDGRQRKMQHDKILINKQTLSQYRNFFQNQYNQQLFQLRDQIETNRKLSEIFNQQLAYAETLITANHKLMEAGDIKVTDFILAINNYLDVRQAIVQNEVEKYLLINQINYWSRQK